MRIIGLMSGTSLDGIDAAAVDVEDGERPKVTLLAFATTPYPPDLRDTLRAAMPPAKGSTSEVSRLNVLVGEAFADAALSLAREHGLALTSFDCIGSHGQTLFHEPGGSPPSTLQVGSGAVIAARTGIATVADFRAADIAAGGQGAPLVPYVDHLLLSDQRESRAAVNVGGIANVTLLPAGARLEDVRGFDTGPGNMLIDECVRMQIQCGMPDFSPAVPYDVGGAIAASGRVSDEFLHWLLGHPFFKRMPPKSTGREEFGADYARKVWEHAQALHLDPADAIATVTKLTVLTIADAIPNEASRVIVSGGGVHNATLMRLLSDALAPRPIETSDAYGLPADAKEAIAFALLARATMRGIPANVPAVTGATKRVILGAVYPVANRSE